MAYQIKKIKWDIDSYGEWDASQILFIDTNISTIDRNPIPLGV